MEVAGESSYSDKILGVLSFFCGSFLWPTRYSSRFLPPREEIVQCDGGFEEVHYTHFSNSSMYVWLRYPGEGVSSAAKRSLLWPWSRVFSGLLNEDALSAFNLFSLHAEPCLRVLGGDWYSEDFWYKTTARPVFPTDWQSRLLFTSFPFRFLAGFCHPSRSIWCFSPQTARAISNEDPASASSSDMLTLPSGIPRRFLGRWRVSTATFTKEILATLGMGQSGGAATEKFCGVGGVW